MSGGGLFAVQRPRPRSLTRPPCAGARESYGDRDGPRRGGFDDDPSRPPREEMGPSRADEDRDWGASKKFVPTAPSERRAGGMDRGMERGGEREREPALDGPSRADGDRDWGASKKFVPSAPEERGGRYEPAAGGFGGERRAGGFGGREGGFGGERREEGDRWGRREAAEAPAERPRLQLKQRSADEPPAAAAPEAKPSIFGGATPVAVRELPAEAEPVRAPAARVEEGRWERRGPAPQEAAARPAERPKLQLAPRAGPAPPPSASASLAESGERASLFGDAKPRELKLAEEGKDWRVEDAKVAAKAAAVARDDTPAESALRAELASAVSAAAAEGALAEAKAAAQELELRLAKLTLEVDDQRRFATAKKDGAKEGEGKWRKEGEA